MVQIDATPGRAASRGDHATAPERQCQVAAQTWLTAHATYKTSHAAGWAISLAMAILIVAVWFKLNSLDAGAASGRRQGVSIPRGFSLVASL
jgi:hypothetical protein